MVFVSKSLKIQGVGWERREGEVLIGGDLIMRHLEGLVKEIFSLMVNY